MSCKQCFSKPIACGARPAEQWVGILRSMATRRALDHLRRRKTFAAGEELDVAAASDDPVADAIGELAQRLSQALTELPLREAEVFCLRFFEDFSYQQIAEQLSIQVSAVSTALE